MNSVGSVTFILKRELDAVLDRENFFSLMKALRGKGVKVKVYAQKRGKGDPRYTALPCLKPPLLRHLTFGVSAVVAALGVALRERPDRAVVDFYTAPFALLPALFGRLGLGRTRWWVDYRTLPAGQKGPVKLLSWLAFWWGALCSLFYSGTTAITEPLARHLCRFGLRPCVWGSSVDTALFDPSGQPPPPRPPPVRFLYHGALNRDRGVVELARAALQVEGVELSLIGGGNALAELGRLAGERVRLSPPLPQSELPARIARSHFGVLPLPDSPQYRTSFPIKLLECLAMNRPVVTTDIEANRALLEGRLRVNAGGGSEEELVRAIETARDRVTELCPAESRSVAEQHTVERVSERLLECLA